MESGSRKRTIVWGGLLILFGALALAETFYALGAWMWIAVLAISGIVVFGVYVTDSSDKSLLIFAYVLLAVALLVALLTLNVLRDPFIATFVLLAVALPFLGAFLKSGRTNWGLLLPAYILTTIGIMVPLNEIGILRDTLVASYVLFAVAIPFFVTYIRNRENWWALIPGGVISVVGLALLIASRSAEYIFPALLIIAGVGVLVSQFIKKEKGEQ